MSDLMLLSNFGQRNLRDGGRVTLDKITDDMFVYSGSVIFPDGKYVLDHQKVQRCKEDREYYLTKYVILSKAVAGDEKTLERIFKMRFIRHTDYGPEDVHPDDPYGFNPFALAREAEESVNYAKKENERRISALNAGYTVIDFMIADGLLVPVLNTEQTFAYDNSPKRLFTNVRINATRRLLLSPSDPVVVNGSEMKHQDGVSNEIKQFIGNSRYDLCKAQGHNTVMVHLTDAEGSGEEMIYASREGSSVVLQIGKGRYPGTVQYHLREPNKLPRTFYRIVDGWGSNWDAGLDRETLDGRSGYVTNFHIDVSTFNGITHQYEPFTYIFGLVKLIQDVTGISSTRYLGAKSKTQ